MRDVELDDLMVRCRPYLPIAKSAQLDLGVMELRQQRNRMRDKLLALAGECAECAGTGTVGVAGELLADCGACGDIRRAARL